MRPVRSERGQITDLCYLCEREEKKREDSTVIEERRKRDGQED
jgi:hypothetical protein